MFGVSSRVIDINKYCLILYVLTKIYNCSHTHEKCLNGILGVGAGATPEMWKQTNETTLDNFRGITISVVNCG